MHGLIALESLRAADAVAEYGSAHGWSLDVAASLDEAVRLSRFRHYDAVICDESFEGIARAAKRVDVRTRTIVLTTSMPESLGETQRGVVDVVLVKPQPLSLVYACAARQQLPPAVVVSRPYGFGFRS